MMVSVSTVDEVLEIRQHCVADGEVPDVELLDVVLRDHVEPLFEVRVSPRFAVWVCGLESDAELAGCDVVHREEEGLLPFVPLAIIGVHRHDEVYCRVGDSGEVPQVRIPRGYVYGKSHSVLMEGLRKGVEKLGVSYSILR